MCVDVSHSQTVDIFIGSNGDIAHYTVCIPLKNVNLRQILDQNNLEDISEWDVSLVTNITALLSSTINDENDYFNEDINKWNISRVTTMEDMFFGELNFNSP